MVLHAAAIENLKQAKLVQLKLALLKIPIGAARNH